MTLLVVSAWLPEQQELRKWVENADPKVLRNGDIDFLLCGIGPINAACAVTAQLHTKKYKHILFCGTAGAYSCDTELLSVFTCRTSRFTDAGAMMNLSYLPGSDLPYQQIESVMSGGAYSSIENNIERVDCLTLPSITRCETLSAALGALGCLENMELFGVATAAGNGNTTWSAVLGVANYTGLSANTQWQSNHLAASVAAQAHVWQAINS